MTSRQPPDATAGAAVDAEGYPVPDPTKNVLDLVEAAIQRQDDLRAAESRHLREIAALRAEAQAELRNVETARVDAIRASESARVDAIRAAETARIDAIRAVDVQAVQRAAEVSATQAATLATQVATSAETLRTQVAAAAQASTVALAAALDPVKNDIADLRKTQYEQAGQKAQVGESRLNYGAILGSVSLFLVLVFGILSVAIALNR